MPDFNTIADVSTTLRDFLKKGLEEDMSLQAVNVDISDLLQANIPTNPARVTLFLFEVLEDPSTRNRPRIREPDKSNVRLRKPQLTLLLRYLVTPWSGSPDTDQRILGRITQLIYDESIISANDLHGTALEGTSETLKVVMSPLTLEERTRIWNAVHKPYRLSVTYEVRVVNIDSRTFTSTSRVSSREIHYGQMVEES
ncbi:MAG TPA: DUF4255 domain-containing protein [Planctomycetaceae bacterium]|nr:DUF4255 domain-containing protein [Planctomycetaceae bacterium]